LLQRTARHTSGQQSQHSEWTSTAPWASVILLLHALWRLFFLECVLCTVVCAFGAAVSSLDLSTEPNSTVSGVCFKAMCSAEGMHLPMYSLMPPY
jgi:hypothetical protein